MARTGRFGRLPRAVPSLTATLLAIAREQEQQRDQNLMEAWQRGGLFEGEPATDERVLAHWQKRLEGIDPDDPLYNMYKNAILQYEYAIAESKMTVEYAHGRISDATAAKFYLDWAKRVPTDSEFYRVLQRDAAQYLRAAKAKGASETRARIEARYNAQMADIERREEAGGQYALWVLTMLGQRGSEGRGAVLGESPLGSTQNIGKTTNIGDVQLPAVDDLMALLETVTVQGLGGFSEEGPTRSRVTYTGNPAVLFHDESGLPVTGADIVAALRAADPTFDGNFDLSYVGGLIARQKDGLRKRITLAKDTGHVSDMVQLETQLATTNEYGNQLAAWPVTQMYADLKEDLDAAMRNDGLLPAAKLAAIDRFRAAVGKLADDPRIAADDHLQSQLRGEAEGVSGTVTVAEDLIGVRTGYSTGQSADTSEVMELSAMREAYLEQVDLTSDPASGYYMTQGNYTRDGEGNVVFVPRAGGKAVGAATMEAIANTPGAGPPVSVMVPNGDGGGATPMMLVPAAVTATAKLKDGTKVAALPGSPQIVATFLKFKVNNTEVTIYGVTDAATGHTRWTADPPWDTSRVKVAEGTGGLVLDLSAVVPQKDTTGPGGGPLGNGFTVVDKGGARANRGRIAMDPTQAVFATLPERQAAGVDPNTDSFSPTLVALKQSPDGVALLRQYADNAVFQQVLENDAYRSSGMKWNMELGIWEGSAQQQALFDQFSRQVQRELDAVMGESRWKDHFDPNDRDAWYRDSTQTQMGGGALVGPTTGIRPRLTSTGLAPTERPSELPLDAVRRAGDVQRFAALTSVMEPGTNRRIGPRPPKDAGSGIDIKAPLSLVVPANPFARDDWWTTPSATPTGGVQQVQVPSTETSATQTTKRTASGFYVS